MRALLMVITNKLLANRAMKKNDPFGYTISTVTPLQFFIRFISCLKTQSQKNVKNKTPPILVFELPGNAVKKENITD